MLHNEDYTRKIDHTSDPIVQEIYRSNDNYLIQKGNVKNKICLVFFSSNGLYYPNEEGEFVERIIKENRFEWINISSDIKNKAEKFIFLRDIHKQWYVEGVNEKLNSISSLYNFLKNETLNYEVIAVGSSAGGYAATLFGCLLNSKRIINISGQYFFPEIAKEKLLVKHIKNYDYSKYYDLRNVVDKYKGELFYIFPYHSDNDIIQYNYIKDLTSIIPIKINATDHGHGLKGANYKYFFFCRKEKLLKKIDLEKEYTDEEIFFLTMPIFFRLIEIAKMFFRRVKPLVSKIK